MKKVFALIVLLIVALNFDVVLNLVTNSKSFFNNQMQITKNISCDFYECNVISDNNSRFDTDALFKNNDIQIVSKELNFLNTEYKISFLDVKNKLVNFFGK